MSRAQRGPGGGERRSDSRSTLVACNTEDAQLRFLILNAPTPSNLPEYIEDLRHNGVKHLVRVCVKTYDPRAVENAGIRMYEWQFPDGSPPPDKVLLEWLDLVERACRLPEPVQSSGARLSPGFVDDPRVVPLCPITHAECRAVRVEETEPESGGHTCSACHEQVPDGETMWRCDASGWCICRRCKEHQSQTQTIEVGGSSCPKKGSPEEAFGVTLRGLTVTDVAQGGVAAQSGIMRGMVIRRVGDTEVWERKELDSAFAAAKAPFAVQFQVDYLMPCVGVHCIAGLGRAPVLVAVALVELAGVEASDAISYLRQRRTGCFNTDQVTWLLHYKKLRKRRKKSKKGGDCCGIM